MKLPRTTIGKYSIEAVAKTLAKIVGYVLQWTGSYLPVFIITGSAYLAALCIIHLISPKCEQACVEAD